MFFHQNMQVSFDNRNMYAFFCGLWKFSREVKAITDNTVLAKVVNGSASYVDWNPETQPGTITNNCGAIGGYDCAGKQVNTDTGSTSNTSKAHWLLYREAGQLQNFQEQSSSGPFSRQYAYKFNTSEAIDVFHIQKTKLSTNDSVNPYQDLVHFEAFEIEKFFHNLKFSNVSEGSNGEIPQAVCEHLCEPDTYTGMFQIWNKDMFTISWEVTGPQKSFKIHTCYDRLLNEIS